MAKKNYRPNAQARKKNEARKLAERQEFYRAHRKQIILAAAAAVVVILVIALLIDIFYVPAGALRTVMGKVSGVEPNSIVRELDGRYYEFAKMDTPEGYAVEEFGVNLSSNTQEQALYFVNQAEAAAVESVYVCGVKEKRGTDMIATLVSNPNAYAVRTEGATATVAGHEVNYLYGQSPVSVENLEGDYYAALVMYVDTIQGSSVLVQCTTPEVPQAELPTEQDLLAEAEKIVSCLTLP